MARRRGKKQQTTNNNWHEQPQLADTELQLGGEGAGAGAGQLGNHRAEDTQYYTQHCSRATVV